MTSQDIKQQIIEIEQLVETGCISVEQAEYEIEHLRMKYYELTDEMPD